MRAFFAAGVLALSSSAFAGPVESALEAAVAVVGDAGDTVHSRRYKVTRVNADNSHWKVAVRDELYSGVKVKRTLQFDGSLKKIGDLTRYKCTDDQEEYQLEPCS